MRQIVLMAVVAVAMLACAGGPREREAARGAASHTMYPPAEVQWQDGPASLPPGARLAVLEGDPARPGYFAMRLQLPDGYRIAPHWHPNFERVTVISGTLYMGAGERFDTSIAHRLPAGSYSSMEPGMRHYAWAEGPTVIQIATIGPWAIHYVDPADDPRRR